LSVPIPEYEKYTLLDLYQVLNSIRKDLVPHVYEALVQEIHSRVPKSVDELEDCYFALDKERSPEFAGRLEDQIAALGGSVYAQSEPITDENKYRTFWRRFWAHFVDGLLVGIPLVIFIVVLERTGAIQSASGPYLQQFTSLVGLSYYIIMHAKFGQTVGKMATGVKVFDKSEGIDISWKQAVLRDIVPVVFFVVSLGYVVYFGVSIDEAVESGSEGVLLNAYLYSTIAWSLAEIFTMLFNRKKRAVHDFIAGTVVVRVYPIEIGLLLRTGWVFPWQKH